VAVLGAFDSPHGNEHLARMLAADLLWADPMQALTLVAAAAAILAVHRLRPDIWARDAVFYPGFALVAGVAVPALGLFVVFACLIVPALWMRAGWRLTPALGMTLVARASRCPGGSTGPAERAWRWPWRWPGWPRYCGRSPSARHDRLLRPAEREPRRNSPRAYNRPHHGGPNPRPAAVDS
jgi:hypothetical protein